MHLDSSTHTPDIDLGLLVVWTVRCGTIQYVQYVQIVRYVQYVQYVQYAHAFCTDRTVEYMYSSYGMYVRRYVLV